MGFKTKWNRFWTLRNSEGGFTLVELVVVIAILAILAGVAVPAYTGYIKKAREAGDQLLIAAVNEAFVSSCLEAGVEMIKVTDAKVSVSEQLVFGVSSVDGASDAELNVICSTFNQLFEGNFKTPFVTENVKSLYWVPAEASFKMDHVNSVPSRIMLSSGKSFTVDPDTMAAIQASAYADMGYTEVAKVIDNLGSNTEDLASIAKTFGLMGKFTSVMQANGLVDDAKAAESMSATEAANGLQMVTAKYLAGASDDDIDYLLNNVNLEDSWSMLGGIAGDAGGTRTVAAAALQYALVEAFANGDDMKDKQIQLTVPKYIIAGKPVGSKTITTTVSAYLASEDAQKDPISAMAAVRNSAEYKAYATEDNAQYQQDISGFVGTMSILGDNLGTTTTPGSIDINEFFQSGIHSQDAQEGLTAVLGK